MFCEYIRNIPVKVVLQSDDGIFDMEGTSCYTYNDVTATLVEEKNSIRINISALKTGVRSVTFTWKADLPTTIKILGDHWERGYGDLEWRGIAPDRALPWYFLINNGANTEGIGVKTGASSICYWNVTRDSISLCVDTKNGASGVLLSGRTLSAATIVTLEGNEGESPFAVTRAFCKKMCDNPRMPAKPLYGANNWYYAYGVSSQKKILEDGKFISSLADSTTNRPFMFIDDGWQICRNKDFIGGPWNSGNRKFPDMPKLAEDLQNDGVQPGLWIRPLLNCLSIPTNNRLPSVRFLSRNDCCSGSDLFLDPSVPEVLEIIHDDMRLLSEWGYRMIKHDFTTYDILGRWGFAMNNQLTNEGWHFYDRSKTTAEIISNLYLTIRKGAGDSMVLGCNTIGHLAAGIFEAQRTGDDTSGFEWSRTRKMGVNTLAFRIAQHNAFFAADADCIGITEYIPWELNCQWLELVAKSGTPLIVSIDSEKATEEQKKAIAKSFTIGAKEMPIAEPLDWMNTVCPTEFLLNGEKRRFNWGC